MTTIAWDGKTLAADRWAVGNGPRLLVRKIARGLNGSLIGAAGKTCACEALVRWIAEGEVGEPPVPLSSDDWSEILVVASDGQLYVYGDHGRFALQNTQMAIGSGAQYALAAMACGRSAAEAVAVAALFDHRTSEDTDELELIPAPPPRRRRS
jgi:hypothetical protein